LSSLLKVEVKKARKKKVYSSQNYYIFTLLPLPNCSPEGNYDVSLLAKWAVPLKESMMYPCLQKMGI